jgi:soluble lytic murein transglycosylase-like protein/rubrerythrin
MRSVIDFAELDLRGALDFAILIEEDAQLRYEQLARLLGDDPGGAGDVFRMMIAIEGTHRTVLLARRAALFQDAPARIEISVMDGAVERPEVEDDDLPRTAREALALSAAAERHAYEFYRDAGPCLGDAGARAFFEELMQEELEHEAVLLRKIAELDARDPEAARRPPRVPAPEPARETFPDLEALAAALPQFDAATRAVARSVILEGMPEREVAAALGVSRRSVGRKLDRFLGIARRHVAAAAAAATLAGCAGNLRSGADVNLHEPAPPQVEVQLVSAHVAGERVQRQDRSVLARKIRAEVARRMPGYDSGTHDQIATTIVAEARSAKLDPLLVLALIHVESSFDPDALSRAGAVGLMQLLEPTMEEELRKAGIAPSDPSDPTANVKAGVRYLRRLLRTFGGEVNVALMAYNAGPGRIQDYLESGEIPVRFHEYPERVNKELARLRVALDVQLASEEVDNGSGAA